LLWRSFIFVDETNISKRSNFMRQIFFVLTAVISLAFTGQAQVITTNIFATDLEAFEAQTGTVIIKGFSEAGSVSTGGGIISVRSKESVNVSNGSKQYGIAVGFTGNDQSVERLLVDYGELDSLLGGIDYLGKITSDATTLPGFEAEYVTKSGLRIIAYSSRKQGIVLTFVQCRDRPRISLISEQMTQLESLIGQAKASLDALRAK
jgi:hypothetical protein